MADPRLTELVKRALAKDPAWDYGSVLPMAREKETGKMSPALPGFLRDALSGTADLIQGPEYGQNLTPEAVSQIFGPGPSSGKSVVVGPGAKFFQNLVDRSGKINVPWDKVDRAVISDLDVPAVPMTAAMSEQKMTGQRSFPLAQVLRHPELYENYPDLKSLGVNLDPSLPGLASYNTLFNSIQMNPDKIIEKNYSPVGIALHELQHALQWKEGMTPGTSPAAFQPPGFRQLGEQIAKRIDSSDPDIRKDTEELADEWDQLVIQAHQQYKEMGGEVESRAVQRAYEQGVRPQLTPSWTRVDTTPEQFYPGLPEPYNWLDIDVSRIHAGERDPVKLTPRLQMFLQSLSRRP